MKFSVEKDELKDLVRATWDDDYAKCIMDNFEEFNYFFQEKMCSVEDEFTEIVLYCMNEAVNELMCG